MPPSLDRGVEYPLDRSAIRQGYPVPRTPIHSYAYIGDDQHTSTINEVLMLIALTNRHTLDPPIWRARLFEFRVELGVRVRA